MKYLLCVSASVAGVISQLQTSFSMPHSSIALWTRHLDHQSKLMPYSNKYQHLQKRGLSKPSAISQRRRTQVTRQRSDKNKDQQNEPDKQAVKDKTSEMRYPPGMPNTSAEVTMKGPGNAQMIEGTEYSNRRVLAGQVTHRETTHPFKAQAGGESTAHPSADLASRPIDEWPVHAEAIGNRATARVRAPPAGKGHVRVHTPGTVANLDVQGGEFKEVATEYHGPGNAKLETAVTEGGTAAVMGYNGTPRELRDSLGPLWRGSFS